MRRITTWLLSTVSALVLLFSYHTSTSSTTSGVVALGDATTGGAASTRDPTADAATESDSTDTSEPTPTGSSSSGSSSSGSGTSGDPTDGTFTGDAVMTRFGAVQVEITVHGGEITESAVTQVPWSDRRDQQINSYAVPILNQEAVQAQSAGIDMVSGATYTSEGYIQSLQSAIDQANL